VNTTTTYSRLAACIKDLSLLKYTGTRTLIRKDSSNWLPNISCNNRFTSSYKMHTTFQNKHKQQSQNSASTVLTSASDKINLDYLETHGRRLTYSGLRTKTYVCMYTVVLFSLKHAKKNQKKFNCIL